MEIRANFYTKLRDIQNGVLTMGSIVEKAIGRSIEALKNRNLPLARQVLADDTMIDQKRFDIEKNCIQLIATQQPMESDLRTIISVLYAITELERMGDHAEGIAKIVIMIGDEPPLKPLIDLPRMAEKTQDMLSRSLKAFIDNDAEAAKQIASEDDEIDELYNQVFRELISFMVEDPRTITRATRLIWVAHNLERCADRVTNICERVIYIVTGKMAEINISKH